MSVFKRIVLVLAAMLAPFLLARLTLYMAYPEVFANLSADSVANSFLQGLRFDLASIAMLNGLPLLILMLPFRFVRRQIVVAVCGAYMFVVWILSACLLIADVAYFGYVKRHITNELTYLGDDASYFIKYAWADLRPAVFVLLAGMIALFFLWRRLFASELVPVRHHRSKLLIGVLAIFTLARGGWGLKPIAIIDAFVDGDAAAANLVLNGVFSATHSIWAFESQPHDFYSRDELGTILGLGSDFYAKPYPIERLAEPVAAKRNIVVLMVESLSHKYVDAFGNNNYGVTPFLDELSKDSIRFTRFYAHGQRSIDGLQAILTGVPVLVGMPTVGTGMIANYTKLGDLAVRNGYDEIFVSSGLRRSFRIDAVAGSAGFKHFYGKEDIPMILDYQEDHFLGWDYESLMFMGHKINEMKKPFFAYIFPGTDHTPYPKLPTRFTKYPHSTTEEGGYLNSLCYTDWALGEFFKFARQQPWFDNTIFFITGDHVIAHFQSGAFLEKFHIPLLVYAPKILGAGEDATIASQLDLLPTFMRQLGFKEPYSALGRDLFGPRERGYAMVKNGSLVGLISDEGYVLHSLKTRMEARLLDEGGAPAQLDILERMLLAKNQLAYDLINKNRWAK